MKKRIIAFGAVLCMLLSVLFRFMYPSPFAATWDDVDFALALDKYDLSAMQPHFPGYPFFILGGMVVYLFVVNPAEALAIFNTCMLVSAVIPMYALARRRMEWNAALLATAVLQTGSYLSILAAQPMSEGMAIAVLWWYLWSLETAFRKECLRYQIPPLMFFALLMGVRLSYAPFGFGLLLLWLHDWKRQKARVLPLIGLAALLQCIWVGALVWNVGSVDGLLKLAFGFIGGHFTEWGGAVTETSEPVWSRLYRLVFENIIWTGLFAHSIALAGVFLFLFAVFVLQWKNIRFAMRQDRLFLILTAVYFLWNLFAQNIDKPRHSYPIVMLLLFMVISIMLQRKQLMLPLFLFASAQTGIGALLIQEQAAVPPATYQLAGYIAEQSSEAIVYTWEETRVMEYLRVPYEHKRFYQYAYFLQDKKYHPNDTIYVTNHLLAGFRGQGVKMDGHLEKVKVFRSNPLFDPVYSEIVLYRWIEK